MRVERLGPRTWAVALLVALSVADPGLVITYGLYVGIGVWLTGAPTRYRIDRVAWAMIASLIWYWLTTFGAINPNATSVFTTALVLGVTFLLLRDAIRTREQLRFVGSAYLIAAAVAVGRTVFLGYVPNAATGRLTLEGLNANYLGYALCGALAIIVSMWAGSSRAGRVWMILASAAIIYGLTLTGTRGAAVGAAVLALWVLLSMLFKQPPIRFLLAVLAVVAFAITSGAIDDWLKEFDYGSRATGDLSGRLYLWPIARELWEQSWFFGSGPQAVRTSNAVGDAHSVFLEIGSAQGIVGVILFVLFMCAALGYGSRGTEPRYRAFAIGAFLAAMSPAYLSGAWEAAPAAMMLVLFFSRIGVPSVPRLPKSLVAARGASDDASLSDRVSPGN